MASSRFEMRGAVEFLDKAPRALLIEDRSKQVASAPGARVFGQGAPSGEAPRLAESISAAQAARMRDEMEQCRTDVDRVQAQVAAIAQDLAIKRSVFGAQLRELRELLGPRSSA
jgi:hypothetical protein